MAAIQNRGDSWRVNFRYQGQQQSVTLGKISRQETVQWLGKIEHTLMRLKQQLLELPEGVPITEFVLTDGRAVAKQTTSATTFTQLRDAYVESRSNGSVESNTLATIQIHLDHIETTLGKNFLLPARGSQPFCQATATASRSDDSNWLTGRTTESHPRKEWRRRRYSQCSNTSLAAVVAQSQNAKSSVLAHTVGSSPAIVTLSTGVTRLASTPNVSG